MGLYFPQTVWFDGDGYETEECSDGIVRRKVINFSILIQCLDCKIAFPHGRKSAWLSLFVSTDGVSLAAKKLQ